MRRRSPRARVLEASLVAACVLTAGTATGATLDYRPDAKIAEVGAPYRGNDIYNLTGAHQQVTVRRHPGQRARFQIALQNDGALPDRLRFGGGGGGGAVRVRYLDANGVDVTAAVVAGLYLTPELAPGAQTTITMRVRIADRAPLGTRWWLLVTGSQHDTARRDAVKATVAIVD